MPEADFKRTSTVKLRDCSNLHGEILSKCPSCAVRIQVADLPTHRTRPLPDDFTVCQSCGQVLVFVTSYGVRQPAGGEIERAFQDAPRLAATVLKMQADVRATRRRWTDS